MAPKTSAKPKRPSAYRGGGGGGTIRGPRVKYHATRVKAPSASVSILRRAFANKDVSSEKAEEKRQKKRFDYAEQNRDLPHYSLLNKLKPDFVDEAKRRYYIADRKEFPHSYQDSNALDSHTIIFVVLDLATTRKMGAVENDFPNSSQLEVFRPSATAEPVTLQPIYSDYSRSDRAVGLIIVETKTLLLSSSSPTATAAAAAAAK